ncbi:MAG: DNA repair protein RecN, partial [bacterium]
MLRRLFIENYTIIARVEVFFESGLNVITGETGVGKSMLLDAVEALMGEKRSSFPIRSGCSRGVVEAEFDCVHESEITNWLKQNDFPPDLPVILRREFYDSGRSRVFINDVPTNLSLCQELSAHLVDLHGQHETVALFERPRQLAFLDAYTAEPHAFNQYKSLYWNLRKLREQLSALLSLIEDSRAGYDALSLQRKELDALAPRLNEIADLEAELKRMENSERIFQLCHEACSELNESPDSAVESITNAVKQLRELLDFEPSFKLWCDELDSIRVSLLELNRTLLQFSRDVSYNSNRAEEIRQRLAALNGFQKRWHHPNTDLLEIKENVASKLQEIEQQKATSQQLEEQIRTTQFELVETGKALSELRRQAALTLEISVHERLANIAMKKARFKVSFEPWQTDSPYADGLDRVDFTLSPDGKIPYQPIWQVASGGEMSRILLALKGAFAATDRVETLIFDEIDQGISGNVARMVGLQLMELSRNHQVIVVTHLPQIASLGDVHLAVRNTALDGSVVVIKLKEDERIEELASLL